MVTNRKYVRIVYSRFLVNLLDFLSKRKDLEILDHLYTVYEFSKTIIVDGHSVRPVSTRQHLKKVKIQRLTLVKR